MEGLGSGCSRIFLRFERKRPAVEDIARESAKLDGQSLGLRIDTNGAKGLASIARSER